MIISHRLRRLERAVGIGEGAPEDRPCRVCADGTRNITVQFALDGVRIHDAPVPPCPGCGRINVIDINYLDAEKRPGAGQSLGSSSGATHAP